MPTLIRLFIVLLVLAGLALAGMIALATFVQPTQKEIRVRIPPQQLGVEAQTSDPLGIRAPAAPVTPPATTTTATATVLPEEDAPDVTEIDIPE